jgi:transposase
VANIICGVDVSGEKLDCSIGLRGPQLQVERTPEGIGRLADFCRRQEAGLVVMEATGGYERLVFSLLWGAGVPCAIANPRSVRRFAEAMGFLEKTDRIDAGLIARYAEVKGIVAQEPASARQQRLRALVTRLSQLTALSVSQSNQRRLIDEPDVLASIDAVLAVVRKQIRQFESQIAEMLDEDPLWRALDEAFRSIKGVADRTVARLMADLPEIGTLSNKAIAKLVGVAPIARDSGKRKGKRSVRGGRSSVRSTLFLVAEVVRRHNVDFADFHQRLRVGDRTKKSVRIALARKLLVRLNAKAREIRLTMAITT